MRIAIIADSFYPDKNSVSSQIFDLSNQLSKSENDVTLFIPSSNLESPYQIYFDKKIRVIRLKALKTKTNLLFKRGIAEFLLSFFMIKNLRKIPKSEFTSGFDAVIWYSPTIFFGGFIKYLKKKFKCPSYLILRDIFPEWMVDVGLLKKGVLYKFFKYYEEYQYNQADLIGLQSKGNVTYIEKYKRKYKFKYEILNNWLDPNENNFLEKLDYKNTYIYAGNFGDAQGGENFFRMIEKIPKESNICFLFIGRGKKFSKYQEFCKVNNLSRVTFLPEIPLEDLESILPNFKAGVVLLDTRHKSHNIPGKFLTYLKFGLPVFSHVNKNNDLIDIIEKNNIGKSIHLEDVDEIYKSFMKFNRMIDKNFFSHKDIKKFFLENYSSLSAADQIVESLKKI